jgi:hypothetical protein
LSERVRRILFFHPHFRDGGVERGMVLLTREFRTLGVRSEVATFGTVGHFAGVADAPPFVDLGARRALTSLFPLARHLRRTRPDWVVSAQNFANVIAVLANILAGRPSKVLVTERNAVSRERVLYAGRLGMGKLKSRILLRVMRWIYPLADRVAANSADGAKDLAETIGMPLSRVKVLYNPTFDPRILEAGRNVASLFQTICRIAEGACGDRRRPTRPSKRFRHPDSGFCPRTCASRLPTFDLGGGA